MADLERIKRDIREIAARPKAVRFEEITRIIDQLEETGYSARYRKGKEAWIFYIQGELFTMSDHHPGSSHLKSVYVNKFLSAMINLGLYEGD